ncbi:hypothetical protein [Teredinibacter haidensis]|uniref:hypothetical protein n=1 Tax=Teredinibacter haidensis TaxID=2731755 RepID=UPI000948DB7F|nr:hypothetical protein [Teredinibacter haidensis]
MCKPSSKRSTSRQLLPAFLLGVVFFCLPLSSYAQHVYYRYINKDGVKVLDHYIPPEYAQDGYEVINASGQVVKVVPPAPSEEDLARNAAEREIQEVYARLKRRYSSAKEIESAKQRRLKNINTNISILNGNISGLNNQIEKIMSKAASFERKGSTVPENLLQQLIDVRAELAIADELMQIRQAEYEDVITKYDEDISAFSKGVALDKLSKAKIQ